MPGEGVDCINFVMAILEESEVVPRGKRLPFYDERLGSFRARNVMEDLFVRFLHTRPVDVGTVLDVPEFGDVVICQCGKQTNHVGIVLDGWMWHVTSKAFVLPEPWEIWRHRSQRLIRFIDFGWKEDPHGLRWDDIKGLADRPA